MQKKIKFKPKITRIRLNPDQAVLSCDCFNKGKYVVVATVNSRGASFIQDVSSHPWDGVACNYNHFCPLKLFYQNAS